VTQPGTSLRLFRTREGALVEHDGRHYPLGSVAWDDLLNDAPLWQRLHERIRGSVPLEGGAFERLQLLSPVGRQEVWGSGVTYTRSREAREEEARDAGGGDFYARVYSAERPELFPKAVAHRVVGSGAPIRIRADSRWSVPEPELTLFVDARGSIQGYTVGDDVSARDVEGENPLYLPQAKVYDGSCALGPGILAVAEPLRPETVIAMEIRRDGATVFDGATSLGRMKRRPDELVEFLFRECSFPHGCFLMTGTGIVPPSDFTLRAGDVVRITIDPIGTLVNTVA
jgi:2-dehydro-3-deoxy-D-arabinonate dehydratase